MRTKERREEGDAGRNEGVKKRIRNKQGNEEEGHEVTDADCLKNTPKH